MKAHLLFISSCLFLGQITEAATSAPLVIAPAQAERRPREISSNQQPSAQHALNTNATSRSWLNDDDDLNLDQFKPPHNAQPEKRSPHSAYIRLFNDNTNQYIIAYTAPHQQTNFYPIERHFFEIAINSLIELRRYHVFTFLNILHAAHTQPLCQATLNNTIFYEQPDVTEGDFGKKDALFAMGFLQTRDEDNTLTLNWLPHLVILCFVKINADGFLELKI